ncbi:Inactive protein RESTRICTED TEV MOVEMENT 2 [Bienertia sinuspersici]
MASKTETATITPTSYKDFEPYCEWKKEDAVESLVFHLPDFKKDQLRVQVNNLGILKVSGERPITEKKAKIRRFIKESKLPQGCDINDIRAKFSGGHLHVTMPKKATPHVQQQQQNSNKEALAPKPEKLKAPTSENDHMFGLGNTIQRLQAQKNVNVSLGVAVAAIVAIGAYVAYNYGSSSSPPPSIQE